MARRSCTPLHAHTLHVYELISASSHSCQFIAANTYAVHTGEGTNFTLAAMQSIPALQ
jgi:hypothetical protein